MRWFPVFLAHLGKEWRQHRAVLIGIAVALPVLTAATFVGFASFGSELADAAALFTGAAAVMTSLALAVEVVAGEVTRKTIDFWRRQPHGLAVGWCAKLAMLVTSVALASAWAGACFLGACRVFTGAKAAAIGWTALSSSAALVVPLVALALSMWVLLATTWVSRGAAAVGIALLLLGAIGYPGWVLWSERTVFLRTLVPGSVVSILLAVLLPAAIATLSLFVGRRFGDRPLRAAAVSFAVLAVATGTAYAHASARLDRWDDVRLDDADVRVTNIFVGRGGRMAYVHASRAGDDVAVRSFAIDLQTGVAKPIGPKGSHVWMWSEPGTYALPARHEGWGLLHSLGDTNDRTKESDEFFDGASGTSLGVFPSAPLSEAYLAVLRKHLRETTKVRTTDGRRAWSIHQFVPVYEGSPGGPRNWAIETWIERETKDGGVERVTLPPADCASTIYALSCGWWGIVRGKNVLVPADARTLDDCLPFCVDTPGLGHASDVGKTRTDARHYLDRRYSGKRGVPPAWSLVDVVTKTDVPAPGMTSDDELLSLDGTNVLVWRQRRSQPGETPEHGSLVRVDLSSGTNSAPAALGDGVPSDLRWVAFVGATPQGRTVLVGTHGKQMGYLLFDPASNRLVRWTPQAFAAPSSVALILDEETLYVTGYDFVGTTWGMRLDRLHLGSGERTPLFPR